MPAVAAGGGDVTGLAGEGSGSEQGQQAPVQQSGLALVVRPLDGVHAAIKVDVQVSVFLDVLESQFEKHFMLPVQ